ncbi:MAG: hypothetical protein E7313_06165 [Clostridiales bacterium]|nr:hypothetical protein [Clostridiales bacterium]
MIGIKNDNVQTYTEISCLLECFPDEYINKLPQKLLDLISNNKDDKYIIEIDTNKSINDQNISKKTKNMLAVLKYNYWSTEEEKSYFRKRFSENEKKLQEELREKYNPDNLFAKRNKEMDNNINYESEQTNALIEYKEDNLLKKIIKKIKSFFGNLYK